MTLEDAIEDANSAGWTISNLYQHPTYGWCCNLYNATSATAFAYASDPVSALTLAVDSPQVPIRINKPAHSIEPAFSLADLLKSHLHRPTNIRRV